MLLSVLRMQKIRLTKNFEFESAHALHGYDGPCRAIHGHSYKLSVTVIGTPINDEENAKNGMVMDFKLIKQLVKKMIIDPLDHALILYDKDPVSDHWPTLSDQKLVKTSYNPTCENMLIDFAQKLTDGLPESVSLHSLKLYETSSSFAEWYASDQI